MKTKKLFFYVGILLLAMIWCVPIHVTGQTAVAQELYKKAVSLYNQDKYKAAKKVFEDAMVLDKNPTFQKNCKSYIDKIVNSPKCKTCGKIIDRCKYKGEHPAAEKKCDVCGKPLSKCEYKGNHPKEEEKVEPDETIKTDTVKNDETRKTDTVKNDETIAVKIECNVPDATLYVDGTKYGTVSSGAPMLKQGSHQIKLVASGYDVFSKTIEVNPSSSTMKCEMQKISTSSSSTQVVKPRGENVPVKQPKNLSKPSRKVAWRINAGFGGAIVSNDWDRYYGYVARDMVCWNTGFKLGFGLEKTFTNHLSLLTSFDFAKKGYSIERYNYGWETEHYNCFYAQIPVALSYRFHLLRNINMRINGGIFFAYNFSDNSADAPYGESLGQFEKFDMGLHLGFNFEYRRFDIGLEYERGFVDVGCYTPIHTNALLGVVGFRLGGK